MTTKAIGVVTPVAEPGKKKSRPNPGRRKASSLQAAKSASCDVASASNGSKASSKRVASSASTPAIPRDYNIERPSVKQTASSTSASGQATSKAKSSSGSKSGISKPDDSKSSKQTGTLALAPPAMVTGGLLGCAAGAAVILGAGLWKNFAGAENAIMTARTAKLCLDNLIEELITSLKAGTYNAPEALDMLRRTTLAYASTIPGGAPLVERTFREIDMIRRQRGAEVDKVLAEAYVEVAKAGKKGATSDELQSVVFGQMMRLSKFATNATQDVLARNPTLMPYRDQAAKALRRPPPPKVPTVKINMAIQQKPSATV